MTRVLLTAMALAAFPLNSRGEEAVVHLTVRPMPAPKPALKYQLLPELRELKPGNAAQNYLKCFMEQRHFFFTKEAAAERARYQTMPLAELPVDKLRHYGGFVAASRRTGRPGWMQLDWQTLERIQNGGMETLADELGPLQDLAAALQVRFRAEVAGRHFDDAIGTAKTMFALARHLGEHPTEVADLVGLWVAHLSLGTLEEMVQQPGCPNLYWALTDLPCPLVDLRKGVQGDRTLVAADLRSLRDDAPMTDTEMEEFDEPPVRRDRFRTRTGGPGTAERASPAASAGQGSGAGPRRPPTPDRGGLWAGSGQDVPTHAGDPVGREARLRNPAG